MWKEKLSLYGAGLYAKLIACWLLLRAECPYTVWTWYQLTSSSRSNLAIYRIPHVFLYAGLWWVGICRVRLMPPGFISFLFFRFSLKVVTTIFPSTYQVFLYNCSQMLNNAHVVLQYGAASRHRWSLFGKTKPVHLVCKSVQLTLVTANILSVKWC